MEKNNEIDVRSLLDKSIGNLLHLTVNENRRTLPIKYVINMLLEIEKSLVDVVIDGDELSKYFNKQKKGE